MSDGSNPKSAVIHPLFAMVGIPVLGVTGLILSVPVPVRVGAAVVTGCAAASFGCGGLAWVRSRGRPAERAQWVAIVAGAAFVGIVVALVPRWSKAADTFAAWHAVAFVFGSHRQRVLAAVIPLLWCGVLALSTRWRPARWTGTIAAAFTVAAWVAIPPLVRPMLRDWVSRQDGWPEATALVGKPLPDAQMLDVSGRSHRFSEFRGKLLIVNVWRTWCGPCVEELPMLESLQKELAPRGVVIVGLCDESPENQRKLTDPAHIDFPLLVQTDDMPPPFDRVGEFPSTLLVKPDGTIYGKVEPRSRDALMAALEAAGRDQ